MIFSMKNGQEVRWVLAEDWFAWAKEQLPAEKHAEIEAWYKRALEKRKPEPTVPGKVTEEVHVPIPAEMITDPWSGQPRNWHHRGERVGLESDFDGSSTPFGPTARGVSALDSGNDRRNQPHGSGSVHATDSSATCARRQSGEQFP